jgi:hypothetical protein
MAKDEKEDKVKTKKVAVGEFVIGEHSALLVTRRNDDGTVDGFEFDAREGIKPVLGVAHDAEEEKE